MDRIKNISLKEDYYEDSLSEQNYGTYTKRRWHGEGCFESWIPGRLDVLRLPYDIHMPLEEAGIIRDVTSGLLLSNGMDRHRSGGLSMTLRQLRKMLLPT